MRLILEDVVKKIILFAIFVAPFGAQILAIPTPVGKLSLFRIAILLALMLFFVEGRRNGGHKWKLTKLKNRYSVLFMLFWLTYAFFSVGWAMDISEWIRAMFFIFVGVATVVLLSNYFVDKRYIVKALCAFQCGVIPQIVWGWHDALTKDYLLEVSQSHIQNAFRTTFACPIACQSNPNDFATLMFVGFFVTIMCYIFTENKCWRAVLIACGCSEVILLIFTLSRANYLGVMMSFAFLLMVVNLRKTLWYFIFEGLT
mgnify:CR=1 FL=1